MNTRLRIQRSLQTHPLSTLLIGLFLAIQPAGRVSAQERHADPARTWRVELRSPGSQRASAWPGDPNLALELRPEGIRLSSDRPLIDIPGRDVLSLTYDTAVYRPVVSYFRSGDWGGWGWSAGEATMEAVAEVGPLGIVLLPVMAAVTVIVPAILLGPIAKTQHFVSIVWRQDDRPRDVVLQIKKSEREEILGALAAATGLAWRDVPAEREQLRAEIAAAAEGAFPLRLDREVLVAGAPLEAGRYQGLTLEREGGRPELLMFRGKDAAYRKLTLRTPVEILPADGPVEATTMTYEQRPSGLSLADLRTERRRVILPEYAPSEIGLPTPEPVAAGPGVRFEWGKYARIEVRRTTRDGEPALVFPARNNSFWNPTDGEFHVTPTKVIFEPRNILHRFSVPRSDLSRVSVSTVLAGGFLILHQGAKKTSLRMLSSQAPSVGLFELTRHGKKLTHTELRVAAFARLAIEDFDSAIGQFEAWLSQGGLVLMSEEEQAPVREKISQASPSEPLQD